MRKSTVVIACSGWLFAGFLAFFITLRPTIIEAGKGGMAGSSCKADIAPPGGDGQVNVDDLVALLAAWGACAPDDQDGDGHTIEDGDCDDLNPNVYPGAPEICDGIDNDCNGVIDDGAATDVFEPNGTCPGVNLAQVVSDGAVITYASMNLVPLGDVDVYRIRAVEGTTPFCFPGASQPYRLFVRLTAPPTAPQPLELRVRQNSCTGALQTILVPPGVMQQIAVNVNGLCGQNDEFDFLVEVRLSGSPVTLCQPYVLQYEFDSL